MTEIVIEPLKLEDIPRASLVIAQAFTPTPVMLAVFKGNGEKQCHQAEYGYRYLLKHSPEDTFVTKDNEKIVGVMRMIK